MDPNERLTIEAAMKDFNSIAYIHDTIDMRGDWHKYLPKCTAMSSAKYQIAPAENTRKTLNVVKELHDVDDQGKSYLCYMFGIIGGLRRALMKVAIDQKSREVTSLYGTIEIYGNKFAADVLSDDTLPKNICSFHSMLVACINNVSPRSLNGLDGEEVFEATILQQSAILENVVNRLVAKNMFEDEGWKRMYGVSKFLEAFGYNRNQLELEAVDVIHSNSVGNRCFQERILSDKIRTDMRNVWHPMYGTTFFVSILYKYFIRRCNWLF